MRNDRKRIWHCRILMVLLLGLGTGVWTGCTRGDEVFLEESSDSTEKMGEASLELSETASQSSDTTVHAEALDTQDGNPDEEVESASDGKEIPQKIFVDVCGAVVNPGVYELDVGSRIFQALDAAGGYLPEAAEEYLNRARELSDGQQIYVPTREEIETDLECLSVKAPEGIQPSQEEGAAPAGSGNAPENAGISEEKIDLNTADASLLSTLSGIGQSKAEAIIAYRQEHGGFSSIEEIMNVEGSKEGTFSKIKDKISAG